MLRAIQEIKPTYVIAENVFGITNIDGGLVFEQVCLDLEAEGYEVQPFIIPAVSKNAPHRRDRCWFIAYSSGNANGLQTKRGMEVDGQLLDRQYREKTSNRFNNFTKNANVSDSNATRLYKQHLSQKSIEKGSRCRSFNETRDFSRFPSQSPICSGNDGLSTKLDGITFPKWRNESIKGYGNAIVPQVAFEIFKALEKTT
jgi:DNA (cytosine-5)-methyltransferase 1